MDKKKFIYYFNSSHQIQKICIKFRFLVVYVMQPYVIWNISNSPFGQTIVPQGSNPTKWTQMNVTWLHIQCALYINLTYLTCTSCTISIYTYVTHSQVPCWTQVGSKSIKQRNCSKFKARSQLLALKGVERHAEAPRWDQEEGQALVTHLNLYQTNQQVGQFTFWNTLGARTSHRQPWTHKTHHGMDSREATTFPHIIFSMSLRDTYIQMVFCPGTPKEESQNYIGLDSRDFVSS